MDPLKLGPLLEELLATPLTVFACCRERRHGVVISRDTDPQVKKIREDVEYYTESNQDPTFVENDFLYDDINMDSLEEMWSSDVVSCTPGRALRPTDTDYSCCTQLLFCFVHVTFSIP